MHGSSGCAGRIVIVDNENLSLKMGMSKRRFEKKWSHYDC